MKLIIPSDFKDLQDNDDHGYTINKNQDKEVLKIYFNNNLIAKRIKVKTKKKGSIRYFGINGYESYLTEEYRNRKEELFIKKDY